MHARVRRVAGAAVTGGLLLALLPGAASAAEIGPGKLPRCGDMSEARTDDGVVVEPWQVVLDGEGVVSGHRLTLRYLGSETTLRTGRRGFAVPVREGRLLIGEREGGSTRLTMIDTRRACRAWDRRLDGLVYPGSDAAGAAGLRLLSHDPGTRAYQGTLLLDPESGASAGLIDGECITECLPNDGDLTLAVYEPAGAPRPVPNFLAGGWPRDTTLPFRWKAGAVPPAWAKAPLKAAAGDAGRTSIARSPLFVYRSTADDAVRYAGTFPDFCGNGIACAARAMPTFWGVWLRPHATDFGWGTLRWCQKRSTNGCFDIRRVMLHELGHIAGLHHPSTAGFRLGAHETVMHAVTPDKPDPGATRHAFGRCDVATLQELYDVPDNQTAISTCNDVTTVLALSAATTALTMGSSVKLTAELRIDDRTAYRRLAGNPLNGRSVKLKYRRADSKDDWKVAWMKSLYSSGRYELTISPSATWEFKATFPAPQDEGLRFSRSEMVKVKVKS